MSANELTQLEILAAGQVIGPDTPNPDEREILGEWLGHFYDLKASGICGTGEAGRNRAAYAAWYSAPKKYRLPRTQEELAKLLNYTSDQVFYEWRKMDWWPKAINKSGLAILEEYNADAHRRLVHLALTEGGSAGVAALRLFYERAGQLSGAITIDLPEDSNFEKALNRAYGDPDSDQT